MNRERLSIVLGRAAFILSALIVVLGVGILAFVLLGLWLEGPIP